MIKYSLLEFAVQIRLQNCLQSSGAVYNFRFIRSNYYHYFVDNCILYEIALLIAATRKKQTGKSPVIENSSSNARMQKEK